jgi:two-component system response regulator AtoC
MPGMPMPEINMDLRQAMTAYRWPGNVRELENFMRKFLILGDVQMLTRELEAKTGRRAVNVVPASVIPVSHASAPETAPPALPVATGSASILEQVTQAKFQAETDAIMAALNSTRWNRKRAARLLNIDYKALLYKMKKLGIDDQPEPFVAAWKSPSHAVAACGD